MNKQEALEIGFKELPHFTVMDSLIFELCRNRHLSFGSIGTPNEMLWICQVDDHSRHIVTDAICLHNYDYDGFITKEKLKSLIDIIN